MRMRLALATLALLGFLLAAPAVHSDTLLTPHAGAVFGGDAADTRLTYGASLAFTGDGLLGFEVEGAYTPEFFEGEPLVSESNVTSLMGHLLLGTDVGGRRRVFASAGAGLLKTRIQNPDDFFDVDSSDFGVSAGLGAYGLLTGSLGLRGDVRYYRTVDEVRAEDF